ncbi:MAG TPA: hypothetical protein VFX61_13235, partial [Micromonosporaceae bacterium]|nr:hypothetical protein [Micromonosporaceae bacterium]
NGNSVIATGSGVMLTAATGSAVTGNRVTGAAVGVDTDSASNPALVVGNRLTGCTTLTSVAGTGNVVTNNI